MKYIIIFSLIMANAFALKISLYDSNISKVNVFLSKSKKPNKIILDQNKTFYENKEIRKICVLEGAVKVDTEIIDSNYLNNCISIKNRKTQNGMIEQFYTFIIRELSSYKQGSNSLFGRAKDVKCSKIIKLNQTSSVNYIKFSKPNIKKIIVKKSDGKKLLEISNSNILNIKKLNKDNEFIVIVKFDTNKKNVYQLKIGK